MSGPVIIFLDDHIEEDQGPWIRQYLGLIQKSNMPVVPAPTLKSFRAALEKYHLKPQSVAGFVIDVMLTYYEGEDNFAELGFPEIPLLADTAGMAIVEFLRTTDEDFGRPRPQWLKCFPLHPVFVLTTRPDSIELLTEAGQGSSKWKKGVVTASKGAPDTERRFLDWIDGLTNGSR